MFEIPLDYATLKLIWWGLLGVLLAGFALMDGFDLGVGILLPWVARTDNERRVMLNTVGPVWEGNQVWLVLGGGAVFAAWPFVYAAAFSGFYLAMFLLLLALILRPVGFDFRSKMPSKRWRATWDWALFIAGFVPALVFGVAVGNLFTGVAFDYNADLRLAFTGNVFNLFTPFPILCGLVSVMMLTMHGGAYTLLKTEGMIAARTRPLVVLAALVTVALFALGGVILGFGFVPGHIIIAGGLPDGVANPLHKQVLVATGAWLGNYHAQPLLLLVPAAGLLGGVLTALLTLRQRAGWAMVTSALTVGSIVTTSGVSLFPFIMPSNLNPNAGLTVWDASSSHLTLFWMLVAVCILLPIVACYVVWAYKVMWGRVTVADVESGGAAMY